jgi:MFS family permease
MGMYEECCDQAISVALCRAEFVECAAKEEPVEGAGLRKWWTATVMGLLGYFVWGIGFFAVPVFYVPLEKQFSWTRGEVTLLGALILLLYSVSMPVVGILTDRYGVRRVVLGGVLLSSVSLGWLGIGVNSLAGLYAVGCLNGVACACVSLVTSQVLVARWFPEGRAVALGYLMTVTGLGGVAHASMAGMGIAALGWRRTVIAGDLLLWLVALPLGYFALEDRREEGDARKDTPEGVEARAGRSLQEAVRSGGFYVLWSAVFLGMAVGNSLIQNVAPHVRDLGQGVRFSGYVISALVTANITGRLIVGWISERTSVKFGLMLSYFLMGASVLLLILMRAPVALVVAATLAGFGYGGSVVTIPACTTALFGMREPGRILGVVLFGFGMGGALGAFAVGKLYDARHSYGVAFAALAVTAAIASALAGMVKMPDAARERPKSA